MTQMPELVAAMHSLVGLAAVLIAIAAVNNPAAMGLDVPITFGHKLELFIGTFIGAITFSGSVIAFGKLSGTHPQRAGRVHGPALRQSRDRHRDDRLRHLVLHVAAPAAQWLPFIVMTALAFLLGFLLIIPIGGADMPVVISMLNSYSGWAAAGIGFSLDNPMLIIAGSLVGSSRRDPVVHHVQGDEPLVLQRDPRRLRRRDAATRPATARAEAGQERQRRRRGVPAVATPTR